MIRVTNYADRRPGDIFLVNNPDNALSKAIVKCELELHPLSPTHIWVPSHAGIFAEPGWVCEAWLDLHTDSAVAMNPDSKYDGYMEKGQMQVWRCEAGQIFCQQALDSLRDALKGDRYSLANLFGFGVETLAKFVFDREIDNPVDVRFVCSQVALGQVLAVNAYTGAEQWARGVRIQDCSPDVLAMAFQEHSS
jgi:hypothetical protein